VPWQGGRGFKSKIPVILVLVLGFVSDYEDENGGDFISPPAISFVTSPGHL